MKKIFLTVSLMASQAIGYAADCENVSNDVPVYQIEEIFNRMSTQAKWSPTQPLLFGYFFMDRDKAKLEALDLKLASKKYRYVNLFFNGKSHVLRVEKIEIHTPESLNERNKELDRLAKENCVWKYDGFDVGKAT